MELTLEQLQVIACGADRVTCENGVFRFYRFTQQQMELYKDRDENDYLKTFQTSGIKLRFRTNSQTLYLAVDTSHVRKRFYFSFSVLVDGKMIGSLRNFRDEDLTGDYAQKQFPHEPLCGSFSLGEGEKEVCIYFPWSCAGAIRSLRLEEGSTVEPVKWSKKLLAFGDSITHGYDARYPHNKYISRLAEALDAEEFNKGIGGEVFFPALAATRERFTPDYILVAYGTNDWRKTKDQTLKANSRAFYESLSRNYPAAKIFALTPVWRDDHAQLSSMGPFSVVQQRIAEAVEGLENVTLIPGFDLVPHDPALFGDLGLHPSDQGFDHYFRNLYQKVRKILPCAE